MEFKTEMEFETTQEVVDILEGGNHDFSSLIVDEIISNLKTRKRSIPIAALHVDEEDLTYEITVEKKVFKETLQYQLEIMESFEDYERCQKIVDAVKYLETK
jgi:hypothetical protein